MSVLFSGSFFGIFYFRRTFVNATAYDFGLLDFIRIRQSAVLGCI